MIAKIPSLSATPIADMFVSFGQSVWASLPIFTVHVCPNPYCP